MSVTGFQLGLVGPGGFLEVHGKRRKILVIRLHGMYGFSYIGSRAFSDATVPQALHIFLFLHMSKFIFGELSLHSALRLGNIWRGSGDVSREGIQSRGWQITWLVQELLPYWDLC